MNSSRTVFWPGDSKIKFVCLAVILACGLLLYSRDARPTIVQDGPPKLRVGHVLHAGSLQFQGLDALKTQLTAKGTAEIELMEKPGLGEPETPLAKTMRDERLDLAVVPLNMLTRVSPQFGLFQIPFLFRDEIHAETIQRVMAYRWLRELPGTDLVGISFWPGDLLLIASRKPILEPQDLQGLKIAALQPLPKWVPGAMATRRFAQEVSASLAAVSGQDAAAQFGNGKIDVIEGTIEDIRSLGTEGISITKTNHIFMGYAFVANSASWAALPAKIQDGLLDEISEKAHALQGEKIKTQIDALSVLKYKQRVSIFDISPKARSTYWRDTLANVSPKSALDPELIREAEGLANQRMAMAERDGPEISWNTWLEDSQGKDTEILRADNVYRVYLDLARYPYRRHYSDSPDPGLIKNLIRKGKLKLLLRPVIIGKGLTPAPDRPFGVRFLTADFEKAKAGPDDRKLLQAFDEKKLSTQELSRKVNLGEMVWWDVKAREAGCGGLAITVWDEARVMPLDHIIISFPVGDGNQVPKECNPYGLTKGMGAGLKTLLYAPSESSETGGYQANAALHIFEVNDSGRPHSIAVFVDSARLARANNDPEQGDKAVYAWELNSILSTYASAPDQLPNLITMSYDAIGQTAYPFQDVAVELAEVIFGGATDSDRAEAAKARSAFTEVVNSAKDPTILVRLVKTDGRAIYLPLGLLAARVQNARTPAISRRFTVIQPMQNMNARENACIGTWWVARPPALQGVTGDARDLLLKAANQPPVEGIELLPDHDRLIRYLQGDTEIPGALGGEGLILLAHHYSGFIRFGDAAGPPARISREYITRHFPSGSVAILAACSTTGKDLETQAIVDQLEKRGVEAMIISPFAVDSDFGTRFAMEFEKVIMEERSRHSGATMLEIYKRASDRAAAAFEEKAAYRDMALEFQLVGDPNLPLCK